MGNAMKFHPLTGAPIVPLGYRKNGRAIWPIMGASEDPPAPDPAPSDPPAPDPQRQPPWGDPANFDAEKAWQTIQNLRKEKGANPAVQAELDQLKQAQQAQQDAIAKALGLKKDEAPDPAALAQQVEAANGKVTEAETRAANSDRRLAVVVAAIDHSANVKALLDSSSFLASIAEIDPADTAAISAAVKKAVDDNDHFKVATTPSFPGGPRKPAGAPEPGPGLPRLRDAYAQSSK
jgi:hypothetical protein